MSARFEIVRTAAGHHARFCAANGRIVWTTEVYTDGRRAALAAVHQIAKPCPAAPWPTAVLVERHGAVEVRDVDERPSVTERKLEPPFYIGHGWHEPPWHDSDYHYRNCFGAECAEGTPPRGALVRGRVGIVRYYPAEGTS